MVALGNVLITGCSTGIGRATALHLDRLGYRVFASVRRTIDMQTLCAEASDRLTPILLDVTDGESICRAEAEVRKAIGEDGLLGLVNNAGVAFHAPLEFAPLADMRWLLEVNLLGALAVTQTFLPLVRRARGRIVNISSQSVLTPTPFHAPYTISKVGLDAISDALRLELKPFGVQVSTMIVGSMKTPIWERAYEWSSETLRREPPAAKELYGPRLERFREFMAAIGRRGIDPRAVARVVVEALTAKKARHYYWVAIDLNVRLYYLLKDILPEAFQEWVILKTIGAA